MLNGRSDHLYISLYFACETGIFISHLIQKKQSGREQEESVPSISGNVFSV